MIREAFYFLNILKSFLVKQIRQINWINMEMVSKEGNKMMTAAISWSHNTWKHCEAIMQACLETMYKKYKPRELREVNAKQKD